MVESKIPIGKYRRLRAIGEDFTDNVKIKLKDGVKPNIGDTITLDMIEPYESEAVRKVADYLRTHISISLRDIEKCSKEIVALVHEAEDADE